MEIDTLCEQRDDQSVPSLLLSCRARRSKLPSLDRDITPIYPGTCKPNHPRRSGCVSHCRPLYSGSCALSLRVPRQPAYIGTACTRVSSVHLARGLRNGGRLSTGKYEEQAHRRSTPTFSGFRQPPSLYGGSAPATPPMTMFCNRRVARFSLRV